MTNTNSATVAPKFNTCRGPVIVPDAEANAANAAEHAIETVANTAGIPVGEYRGSQSAYRLTVVVDGRFVDIEDAFTVGSRGIRHLLITATPTELQLVETIGVDD